jgi:hypothetical protein
MSMLGDTDLRPERFEPYLAGSVSEAWARCLPVWASRGRVTDCPRGLRRTHYIPNFETMLGGRFVEKFSGEQAFLLDRFEHGSALESACAFDLLDGLAQHLCAIDAPLPEALRTCALPLPQRILEEIAGDWIYRNQGLDTVGKLLEFEHSGCDREPVWSPERRLP